MMFDLILIATFAGAPAAETPPEPASWAEGSEKPAPDLGGSPFPEASDPSGAAGAADPKVESSGRVEPVELAPSNSPSESEASPTDAETPAQDAPRASEPAAPAAPAGSGEAAPPPVAFQPAGSSKRDRPRRPDRDTDWRFELLGGGGTTYLPHSSFGLFDQDDRRMNNAGVAFRFDRKLNGPVFLGAGLGYRYMGSETGGVFGSRDTEIDFHEMRAFMRVAFMPLEGLDLYLAGGVGPSFVDYVVSQDDLAGGKSVELLAEGMGGAMVYLPKRWLPAKGASRFTVGLDLGLAYVFRSPIDVEPSIELDEEPLDHDFPDLGQLRASSLTWRAGVFVRFM